ncbi:MAG TPA: class I SAM-dependent methyltransferase [Mycobacteriales bacterium]|nr:class I SAM-dependent methyltransferase [Mycobacteriales bacterium]
MARRPSGQLETTRANRRWWDASADDYQAEHGGFLGPVRFIWGPEGLDEAHARLLGPVRAKRVLEVGCGAAQCGRWLVTEGARVVGADVSARQLDWARRLGSGSGVAVELVQAEATALPFRDGAFDLACSAYGAVPFVADAARLFAEVARVLRPGGRWVFSVTHPIRWSFPDDPGSAGLIARDSYFDRRPYVEEDSAGHAVYVEHHRTLGDRVRELVGAGFAVLDVVEPEWPDGHQRTWGQWSPLRGRLLPGTAIFVTERRRSG